MPFSPIWLIYLLYITSTSALYISALISIGLAPVGLIYRPFLLNPATLLLLGSLGCYSSPSISRIYPYYSQCSGLQMLYFYCAFRILQRYSTRFCAAESGCSLWDCRFFAIALRVARAYQRIKRAEGVSDEGRSRSGLCNTRSVKIRLAVVGEYARVRRLRAIYYVSSTVTQSAIRIVRLTL